MSNFPPPGSSGGPPPPPPWQNQQPPLVGLTSPAPPKKSNTPKIVIGVVVVAVLAVAGVVVATRGDDKKSVTAPTEVTSTGDSSDTTDVSVPQTHAPTTAATEAPTTSSSEPTRITFAIPPITTSLPNASTVPATAPPPTTAPTTTVPFVLPAGAVDLGHQVYIPVPAGFTDKKSTSGLDTIENGDGSTKLSIQVLARVVGESPLALMQEYADGFDGEFEATSFSSTVRYTVSGSVPAYEYGSFYEGYDASQADGVGVAGAIYVFQRADGLSAVYDVFGAAGMGLPDAAFQAFLASFEAAPLLGPTPELKAFASFRVTTPIALVAVTSLLGYTPAPGFAPSTDPNGGARVSSSDYDFTVNILPAQASADAALQTAQGLLGAEYTGLTFDPTTAFDPYQGLTHLGSPWHGTFTNGSAVTGAIDLYWDPKTMNAIAITRAFYTTADGAEPEKAQGLFMNAAITDDISFGIPNP